MKLTGILLLLVAAGVAFAYFGLERPIVVETTSTTGSVLCTTCSGAGKLYVNETCQACSGSGAGRWLLEVPRVKGMQSRLPPCMTCKGTGEMAIEATCNICGGAAVIKRAETRNMVREGFSPWERLWQFVGRVPDGNPSPYQVPFSLETPLIVSHLVEQAGSMAFQTSNWSGVAPLGEHWTVAVDIQRGAGDVQGWLFYVKDRRVVRTERLRNRGFFSK